MTAPAPAHRGGRDRLGVLADDYTGATDLADGVAGHGADVSILFGVPDEDSHPPDADVVVVGTKTRAVPAEQAVRAALSSSRWLRRHDLDRVYFKYCSTFDSTAGGNIGPVAEALADELRAPGPVVVCPASPEHGRTVYQGHLFVGDQLLAESPMRHHPVNPMTDSSLRRLLSAQTRHRVGLVPLATVSDGADSVRARLRALRSSGVRFAVVDAVGDAHLETIARVAHDDVLATGAAGLAVGLARVSRFGRSEKDGVAVPAGPAVVLAGSCSAATRAQIAAFSRGHPTFHLDPERLARDPGLLWEAVDFVVGNLPATALVYSSAGPDQIARVHARLGGSRSARLVEDAFVAVAVALSDHGVRRVVVAGGETSGAVVDALGVRVARVSRRAAPGVPWLVPTTGRIGGLLLKSGNFGGPDFFDHALRVADR